MAEVEGVEYRVEQNGGLRHEASQPPNPDSGDMGEVMEEVSLDLEPPAQTDMETLKSDISRQRNHSTASTTSEAQRPPPPPPEKDSISTPHTPTAFSTHASPMGTARSNRPSAEASNGANRLTPVGSIVFIVSALEQIASSKEARRKKPLEESARKALAAIKQQNWGPDPEVIFEPLRLATETSSIPLTTTSLDCIGKLISYSYFSIPPPAKDPSTPVTQERERQKPPLIERAIDTICDCFQDEATPAEIQLQIVKSLLAAVLNDKIIVHGSGLLKAVRQVYNIFLLSKSPANQQVAQGTLTQMVGTVFERVNNRLSTKEARLNISKSASERGTANTSQIDLNGSSSIVESEASVSNEPDGGSEAHSVETQEPEASDKPVKKEPKEQLTLKSFENTKSFDDAKIGDNAPTMVTHAPSPLPQLRTPSGQPLTPGSGEEGQAQQSTLDEDEEDEIYVKDAFLVFRSMCRLSTKNLGPDQQQDIRSSNMRSKLVSLAIIRTLLNNYMVVFTSPLVVIRSSTNNEPTSFGQAINQYLRLSLGKNGASSVRQVFECCCEIFWLMVQGMRVMLKV